MQTPIKLYFVLIIGFFSFFTSHAFASAPSPSATMTMGNAATTLIGSQACFSVDISNSGTDTGFGPYYRLALPPQLTLASTSFLGQALNLDTLGTFPAAPGNQVADTRANNVNISGLEGNSLTNLVLPLGSISQNGPTLTTEICLDISDSAVLGAPLTVSLQPVLQYGDTATGDNGVIEGIKVTADIVPTLITFNSANNAPAGKQVPGPTFDLTYQHSIDVANTQHVTGVFLDEPVNSALTFLQFAPTLPNGGTACLYGAAPGSNMSMSCDSITGSASNSDVTSGYSVYINNILDGSTCANQNITHHSALDSTYNASALPQNTSTNSVSARHVTLVKSTSINSANPNDTATISGTIRVSDYVTVENLTFVDQLPDGVSFVSHSSLSINGGGSVAITPNSVVNGDGSGSVTYDLTAVSGNISGGSIIHYSYTVILDSHYNNGDPVLASDSFTVNGTVTYDLTAGATNCSDSHSSSMSITPVTYSTKIINPQAEYSPGDVVTFRLSMSVPSGDTDSIIFSEYFPFPVFDVTSINTTFNNDITHAATDTLASTPTSITVDAATNALIIHWPDISTTSAQLLSVDVNLAVTDDPFADNLYLTSLFLGQSSNTPAVIGSDINSVQLLVRNASLSIVSGVSAISDNGTLTEPASSPANSDVNGVDAGDTITQTITITNDGGSPAYKIELSQADLADLSGYTLTAATLNGADILGDLTGSLSTTLVLDNGTALPAGQSMSLTYSYQLAQSVNVAQTLQPITLVSWSASTASTTSFPSMQDSLDIRLADTSIAASVFNVAPQGNVGKFVTGDIVTYQALVTIPEGTITDLVVDFNLPNGLQYIAASSNVSTAGFTGSVVAVSEVTTGTAATGETRRFSFIGDSTTSANNNDGDNTFTITLNALVLDDAANSATSSEQNKTLNVSATYQGALSNQSDNDSQAFTEHQLSLVATVAPDSNLQAGDSVTVTYVVSNNGTAPAYDVSLADTIDSNLFDVSSVTTGSAGCGYANPNFTCTFASIALGASETVSYTATVQSDVTTGASFDIGGAVTADSQSGVVADERDHSVSGSDLAATQALAVSQLAVIATSETFTTTATTEPLAIGETLTYELVVTIPEGVSQQTTNNDFVSFTLPAGLQYISNSAVIRAVTDSTMTSVTLGGNFPSTDAALEPSIDDAVSISGQVLRFDFGNVDNNDDDVNDEQIIVTISSLVLNTDTNTSGQHLVTTGAVNFLNQAASAQTDSANHSAKVVVPKVGLTHTVTPATVQGDDSITYTLIVTNQAGSNTTNGFDWFIGGDVPAILASPTIVSAVLSRSGTDISACSSFAGNTLSVDGSCLSGGQQGAEHYLAPGESITVVYQASVDPSIGFEQTVANTMNVTMTSLAGSNGSAAPGAAGSDTGERIGDNSNNDSAQAVNDLVKMATANIVSNAPSLTLTASRAQAEILSGVTLNASFSVPVGTSSNFAFTLDLPTGLSYQNEAIDITLPGSNFTTTLSPDIMPGAGSDPIVLNFGAITNSDTGAQTVTIAVDVIIDNILANQDTSVLNSTAALSYTGVTSSPSDTAIVTVIEPNLDINQLITAGNVGSDAGDTISYQVTVSNSDNSATAYRVNLSDLLPSELLGAPDGAGAGPVFSNLKVINPSDAILLSGTSTPLTIAHASVSTTNNVDDTLNFIAFDLLPATTLTYSYDVIVANGAVVGASVSNTSRADYNSLVTGTGRSGSAGNDDDNDSNLDNYYESNSSVFVLDSNIAVQHNLTSGQVDANFSLNETVSMDIRVDISEGKTNNVQLQQVLDSGLTFVSASVVAPGHISYTGAGIAAESPTGTISVDMGDVSNSADADNTNDYFIWRIVSQVNDDITNTANTVLNARATASSAVGNAGPQVLPITVVEPNLITTITPNSATTSLGDEVTFTVQVAHNASGADAFETLLKLSLDSELTYVPGSFNGQGNLDDSNASLLSVDLSSISLIENNKSFSFRAIVNNTTTANSLLAVTLANGSEYSATSGNTSFDRNYVLSGTGNTTASAPSFIDAAQSVEIVGDNGNQVANASETLKYTIVLTNNGPTATNVSYAEFTPTDTRLTGGSLTASQGTVTENNTTDLRVDVGTMNNGDVVTITYQVVIDADVISGSEIIAQGRVDSDQTIAELSDSDGNESNGDQPQITPVGGLPTVLDALYVQQLADWTVDGDFDGNVSPGDTITMSYFIENRGNGALTNVNVTDVIANGLTYVNTSAVVSSGHIDVTGSNIVINIANLNSGEKELATVTLTIDNPLYNNDGDASTETFVMQASINSDETSIAKADQNGILADGYQATSVSAITAGGGNAAPEVVQQWHLSYDIDGDGFVDAGDEVTYWITVVNNGSATASNVALNEVIPTNTSLVMGSVNSSQGLTLTESPVNVYLLDLLPSQLVTLSYTVTVDAGTANGTVVSAQANLTGDNFTAVLSDDNGQKADGINPTLFTVNNSTSGILATTLALVDSSNNSTTGNSFIQSETLTLQAGFTLPAGTTKDVVLTVNIPNGLAYQGGSANLSHTFDTGLSATYNPSSINTTASDALVNVDALISQTANTISLVLGTVVNSDNDANNEVYQLSLTLTSNTAIPTVSNNDYLASASANFLDSLNQGQLSQSPVLTLTMLNQLPIAVNDSGTTDEDNALVLSLLNNDSDLDNGQSLSITSVTTTAHNGTVVIAGHGNSVTYTPAQDFVGSDSFDYTVTDSSGGASSATVTVTVNPVQDEPVASDDMITVLEDSANNTVIVLNNDVDVDGDSLTVISATSSNGTVSINGGGTLNYTPHVNFNGIDIITYSISDGNGGTDTAIVTVTVTALNDAPVAVDDSATVNEDSSANTIIVLHNDNDLDGDALTVTSASSPNGTVTINVDNSLSYTPNADFDAIDTISYSISDGSSGSDSANVTVTVISVNDAPVAVDDSATVNEDSTDNLITILTNDSDIDGDVISVISASAANGRVTINVNGTLTYTPNSNFTGVDTISYTITDPDASTATANVFVTVNNLNDAPIAINDNASTTKNIAINIAVIANDSDIDGDSLTVISASATNASVTINNDGTITYTPNSDYVGDDTITYSISDGKGGQASATVAITVGRGNEVPVAEDDFAATIETAPISIDVLSNDTDEDGDELTVTDAFASHGSVTINADGTITYTANADFIGTDTISYTISDGHGGTTTAFVTVEVSETENLPPIAKNDRYTVSSFESVLFDILSNDSDPEGGTIELVAASISHGTVKIVDGHVEYTPELGMSGIITITYTIKDEHGNIATGTVTITVESDNAPVITLPADLCGEHEVDANALYTRVDLGEASAVDRFGNVIPVSLVDGTPLYPAGLNKAFWQATDNEGNTRIEQQLVCINPLVSIEKDQTTFEGASAQFSIHLNGESPTYPLVVPFTVTGNEDDHSLVSHEVEITAGTQVTVKFDVISDDIIEDDETVTVTLADSLNLGAKYQHNFIITEGNIAPEIELTVQQAQEKRLTVTRTGGVVTVSSVVYDPNQVQGFDYQWQSVDNRIANSSNKEGEFTFEPSDLPLGVYKLSVKVIDSGAVALSGVTSIYINVTDELVQLTSKDSDGDLIPDNIEGYQDQDGDGIPDYLDRIDECNVLQEEAIVHDGYLIEGQAGVCLRRGDLSVDGETGGAQILGKDNILVEDTEAVNVGGVFDYIAYGLPDSGMTFAIVMPQRKPVPMNAVYRKYRAEQGWGFFIEDERNSLWSTQGEPGYCPPPNANDNNNVWSAGLTEGHWCVQQIIEDGGVNDDDGLVNNMIIDPGGVSVLLTDNNLPIAQDDVVEITINVETTFDVLVNDTDEDGDELTITSASVDIGSVVIVDNKLVYIPMHNYDGDITINYGVTDDNGGTDHAVVYLTIKSNLAPDIENESTEIDQGDSVSINLLTNDTDPESDTLSLVTVDNDNVSFDVNGHATFTPDEDFHGLVTIGYSVQDSAGNVVEGSWEIMVTEVVKSNAKTTGGALLHIISLLLVVLFRRRKLQRGGK